MRGEKLRERHRWPIGERGQLGLAGETVGQDDRGRWIALEIHGLGGGLFRTRKAAEDYAAFETAQRSALEDAPALQVGGWVGGL